VACANDVNFSGINICTLREKTEVLLDCCMDVDLNVNTKKSKHILIAVTSMLMQFLLGAYLI
jgi:hypothetical protein